MSHSFRKNKKKSHYTTTLFINLNVLVVGENGIKYMKNICKPAQSQLSVFMCSAARPSDQRRVDRTCCSYSV